MAGAYIYAAGIIALLIYYVYQLAFPRPYPGIPYNRTASERVWGDVRELLRQVAITQDPARYVFEQCRKLNAPVVQLFLRPFGRPIVFIDDAREVKDILSNRTREFDRASRVREAFRPILPHCSLVKETSVEFKAQRRFWEGVMGTSFLRRVAAPKMHDVALELVELFRVKSAIADGRPVYFFADFDLAAFDVIWRVVFGTDLHVIRNERLGIMKRLKDITQPESKDAGAVMPVVPRPTMYEVIVFIIQSVEKSFTSFSQPLHHWLLRQRPAYKEKVALKDRIVDGILRETWSKLERLSTSELKECEETSGLAMGARRALLAKLGEFGNVSPPEIEEIRDELLMFLIAGHETKAVTLSWAVKLLAYYPKKQDKLRKALTIAFAQAPRPTEPSAQDILTTSIPYMDATMEEILRIGNIASRLARSATTDTEVLGCPIPKGALIMCNPYVGKKPFEVPEKLRSVSSQQAWKSFQQWDVSNDEEFLPERWLTEDGKFDPRTFPRLAFSAGPRVCYGRSFALQEFRIVLALLILNFKFERPSNELGGLEIHQRILRVPRHCCVRLIPL